MKTRVLLDNVLLLEFSTRKELTTTMFRVQEFYESNNNKIRNKVFTIEDFIEEFTDSEGNLNYFSFWEGFNVPGHIVNSFFKKFNLTKKEKILKEIVEKHLDRDKDYYVIATDGIDTSTLKHELAHALYYLNPEYRQKANEIVKTIPKTEHRKLINNLKRLQYSESVHKDESQAYLATSRKTELVDDFNLEFNKIKKQVSSLRKLFKVYLEKQNENTFNRHRWRGKWKLRLGTKV
jgi:hypothetical protein